MEQLQGRLGQHAIIGLDTSVFIYHLEVHPRYASLALEVLDAVQAGQPGGVASTVTVMELAVHPWREGRPAVARLYEALLVHFPNLVVADVTRDVARRAAQLRAGYGIRPADALHVATALVNGATGFVTNARALARLSLELDIVVLDDFVVP